MNIHEQRNLPFIVNGKEIQKIYADDDVWLPIKPLCEALNIDYERQRKNIKQDVNMADAPSNQTVRDSLNRQVEMVCLPMSYIIHWLYSVQSKSPEFLKFRFEVYLSVIEFSFGPHKRFGLAFKENAKLKQEAENAKAVMLATNEGLIYLEVMSRVKQSNKTVGLAKKEVTQLLLFNEETNEDNENNLQLPSID